MKKKSKKYEKAIQRYRALSDKVESGEDAVEIDDEMEELKDYLLSRNSFENPLDRETAEKFIEENQGLNLDVYGGYSLRDEVRFEVGGERYAVIAYGVSEKEGGKEALSGMIFVKEKRPKPKD